ncbi:MAG: hypothetical protein OXFUSZZB_001247 [Candidatus Fervidibacter sp.]|jgi:hypothetical protein
MRLTERFALPLGSISEHTQDDALPKFATGKTAGTGDKPDADVPEMQLEQL